MIGKSEEEALAKTKNKEIEDNHEENSKKISGESPSGKRRVPSIETAARNFKDAKPATEANDKEESYYDSNQIEEGYVMSETERRVMEWFEKKGIIWAVPLDKRAQYFSQIKSDIISNSPLKKQAESSLLSRRSHFGNLNLGGNAAGPERKLSSLGKAATKEGGNKEEANSKE